MKRITCITIALLIADFVLRPFLWKHFGETDYGYKIYWICDSWTYFFCYLLIFEISKIIDHNFLKNVMAFALPFAGNKVFESMFFDGTKLDWTEIVMLIISGVIILYRNRENIFFWLIKW